LISALGFWLLASSAGAADLVGVRFGVTSASETRIVVDLTEPAKFSTRSDGSKIFLEFEDALVRTSEGAGVGHVGSYVATDRKNGGAVVFTLAKPASIAQTFEIPAGRDSDRHRLVIDLKEGMKTALAAPAASTAPPQGIADIIEQVTAPTPAQATTMDPAPAEEEPAPAKRDLEVIVIDPGHGGSDPGAASSTGVQEKVVTLAAARRLAEILQERGRYQIVLTRADDSRLRLDQRSRIAREAGADLFISLHADAHEDPNVRGGSIYTLSKDGSERSAREAETSGNFHSVYGEDLVEMSGGDPGLNRTLYELAQKTTATNSGRFANLLLKRLKGTTPLLNNSHRVADLKVLLSPDVPAVLFELAFISNDKDAANLVSPAWRTKTMTAVAASIDEYFKAHTEASTAPPLVQGAPAGR
jgi:N-acetylmuramoyl-L-alanine amidase